MAGHTIPATLRPKETVWTASRAAADALPFLQYQGKRRGQSLQRRRSNPLTGQARIPVDDLIGRAETTRWSTPMAPPTAGMWEVAGSNTALSAENMPHAESTQAP